MQRPVVSAGAITSGSATPVTFGCVGDVHGALGRLERALAWIGGRDPDALLLVGDFTPGVPPGWSPSLRPPDDPLARGPASTDTGPSETPADARRAASDGGGTGPAAIAPVRQALERARATGLPVLFVPGNHDLPRVPLEGNVDRRLVRIGGVRIFGIGGSGPARMGFPYEWTDEALAEVEVPGRDLILAHAPPADTGLDVTQYGEHVGSRTIRALAAGTEGALLCGHIHESAGVERVEGCLCYNAGSLGAPFGRLQAGLLEMDPGTGRARARHFVHDPGAGWRCVAEGTIG